MRAGWASSPAELTRAAVLAGALSGVPSTAWALVTRAGPLDATYAAGRMLLPHENRRVRLLVAAAVVHGALSLGWTAALHALRVRSGIAAGVAIAALDLGLAHAVPSQRFTAVRALPVVPQIADHVLFGILAVRTVRAVSRTAPARPSAPRAVR